MDVDVDVVVVGAGLAGLAAGRDLARAGLRVRVLEAGDRPGGRVRDEPLPGGGVLELGAQWVGRDHRRVLALVDELRLTLVPGGTDGQGLLLHDGEITPFSGRRPPMSTGTRAALEEALETMATERRAAAGDDATLARLRGQTAAGWLAAHVTDPFVADLLAFPVRNDLAADPDEVSAEALLEMATLLEDGPTFLHETEEHRIAEGPAALAVGLADGLDLALRTEVRDVRVDGEVATVATARTGAPGAPGEVTAREVVVAVGAPVLRRIRVEPPLPGHVDQALQRAVMGSAMKVAAVYERPFWRDGGLNGFAQVYDDDVCLVADSSPARGVVGVLTGFLTGRAARRLSAAGPAERRRRVLGLLERAFGPEAASPRDVLELDWSADPFVRGAYAALPLPGTGFEHLREHLVDLPGPVTFAGTELAAEHPGYMEGALESGAEAARRVLARLTSD